MFDFLTLLVSLLFVGETANNFSTEETISRTLKENYPEIKINFDEFEYFSTTKVDTDNLVTKTDLTQKEKIQASEVKVTAYNENSQKTMPEIPQKAIDKSPSLVECSKLPSGCPEKEPKPTVAPHTPTITPTQTPTITSTPLPTPSVVLPEPTYKPCNPPPPCTLTKDVNRFSEMPCPVYPEDVPDICIYY